MSEFEEGGSGFDFDSGVADIAADLGLGNGDSNDDNFDNEEESNELQEENAETTEEVSDTEAPEVVAKAPPASWAKEQHEHWATMTPEQQAYVELREKQMLDGIEQYKQGHQYASEIQRTIAPYIDEIRSFGLTESQAISNLMNSHRVLTQGTLEARQQAFVELGRNIGLIPNEGQDQIDPRMQELQHRIARMEQQEQSFQQQRHQQEYDKVMGELNAFAADPEHPYFDEVADDMLPFLKPGMSMADLKIVYDKAVWANPVTRAKEQAKLVEERTKALSEKQRTEAAQAQKARSANVRPASTNKAASDSLGTWDDTMQAVIAKRKNS